MDNNDGLVHEWMTRTFVVHSFEISTASALGHSIHDISRTHTQIADGGAPFFMNQLSTHLVRMSLLPCSRFYIHPHVPVPTDPSLSLPSTWLELDTQEPSDVEITSHSLVEISRHVAMTSWQHHHVDGLQATCSLFQRSLWRPRKRGVALLAESFSASAVHSFPSITPWRSSCSIVIPLKMTQT